MVEYSNTTDIPWYFESIENKLTPATRQLLETYSNIPPAEVIPHINEIVTPRFQVRNHPYLQIPKREKAWKIRSHMCTGQGLFLDPTISKHPAYSNILSLLKNNATLIDIGTFIGQDLRRLVVDGVPSINIYAVDIVNHWDVGFEMYRDREKFHAHYIESDILHPSPALQELNGKMDIIWITHVLHQWTWEGQILAAKSLIQLTHVGTIIAGYQVGLEAGAHQTATQLMKADSYLHDPKSFERFWDEVGEETGSKWRTEARLKTVDDMGWTREDLPASRRILEFTVERIR